MKKAFLYIILITCIIPAKAQEIDKVAQLVSAENFFVALAKEKGIKKAFLAVSDENTIVFRPDPISAEKFFKNKKDDTGVLWWEPLYARISKSSDWGFTTGPYTYKDSATSKATYYGDYLSVWKKNQKGVWKLAIDLGIPHQKISTVQNMLFVNPVSEKFDQQYSTIRLKEREEIVFSSDELYATALNDDNPTAHKTFLADDCRLLFPGDEPIIGKSEILDFWDKEKLKLNSQPVKADRAYSGELAFTYGDASIDKNGQNKLYHYLRIWELQPGFQWNVIVEVYVEASKI